jgi:hypothetical protein
MRRRRCAARTAGRWARSLLSRRRAGLAVGGERRAGPSTARVQLCPTLCGKDVLSAQCLCGRQGRVLGRRLLFATHLQSTRERPLRLSRRKQGLLLRVIVGWPHAPLIHGDVVVGDLGCSSANGLCSLLWEHSAARGSIGACALCCPGNIRLDALTGDSIWKVTGDPDNHEADAFITINLAAQRAASL